MLIARLLLVFAVLGLPFQAVAAVTMAYCNSGQHHGMQKDGHPVAHHASLDADHGQPCCGDVAQDTVHCHYCSGAALPAYQYQMNSETSVAHVPAVPAHLFLYFPEQPKRPPVL
jgi:hypothetical protein